MTKIANKASFADRGCLADQIAVARGKRPCSLVVRGAKWLDVFSGVFRTGDVAVHRDQIVGVGDPYEAATVVDGTGLFVVPGFIDAHVHVESSLMTPPRFAEAVLPRGTTTAIWDPHEIANVKGSSGIAWALAASEDVGLDLFIMVPSCVPSTSPEAGLETSGAVLSAPDLAAFRDHPRVLGLAEFMNFPGLLHGEPGVLDKLMVFGDRKRDGHCPGLTGHDLNAYGVAGIHSCHESTTLAEAEEKMSKGIHVLIREGSCARNADTLLPLLNPYTSSVLAYCSDDRNPFDIAAAGHIDCLVNKGLLAGHAPEVVFRAASYGPAVMYGLDDRGAVAPGYRADFVLVAPRRPGTFSQGIEIISVYKGGQRVDPEALARTGDLGASLVPFSGKNLNLRTVSAADFRIPAQPLASRVRVIGVIPGQIVTQSLVVPLRAKDGAWEASPGDDVLKIAVFERHHGSGRHSSAFVRGFGLRRGAIATSVNHDSHNVIVVGDGDALMARAVNRLRELDGGIVVVAEDGAEAHLALPVGGLMTAASPREVARDLGALKALARDLNCPLEEPFLTLSFLALPVIPSLKITDCGLVDVGSFRIVPLAV